MGILSFLKPKKGIEIPKEEKPVLTKEQQRSKEQSVRRHQVRIDNLSVELNQLLDELKVVESNFDMSQVKKKKDSSTIIRRMTILKYEIDLREGLVKWLS